MSYIVFRNFTIEPLFTNFDAKFSGYNDISEFDSDASIYIWFYQIQLNPDTHQIISEIDHFYNKIIFLINKIPPSRNFFLFTLVDIFSVKWQNSDFELDLKISEFNSKLVALSKINPNIKLFDFRDFVTGSNSENLINWKYYYTSSTYINPALSEKFQSWFLKKCDAVLSKRKKCLVLDLDNTLWGGILGEDGVENIKIGNSYPGNCYSDFQRYLVEASKSGIILAICSKNNENDALEAFEKNPNMILKISQIVAYKINWNNKPTNIKALANELNIGLDSMVFIDDSPVEREIVKTTLPDVIVPDFPKEPYKIMPFFQSVLSEYFQIYKLTTEDLDKTILYKENFQRDSFKSEFTSIEDYLQNLDIEMEIKKADKFTVSRISQMTQKTNQFNLTTKRYSENDINRFIEKGDLVLCASVKDKFGDNGITLLAIVEFDISRQVATIDSFLLSCRILGRGIENAFLSFVLTQIYKKGFHKVNADYFPTGKNAQVKDFYENNGFKIVNISSDNTKYLKELVEEIRIKSYYKIIYNEL
jgi:FkbH-like protein